MKEKHPNIKPVVRKSNQQIFQENAQKIETKIALLISLKPRVSSVLKEEENKRLEHFIEGAEGEVREALNSKFFQKSYNKRLVQLAKELNAEIKALQNKESPELLAEELFGYLLGNCFENDAQSRQEVLRVIEEYYNRLTKLVGHNLGEKDFQNVIKVFHKLKQQYGIKNDEWTKMLGILLYVDTLISPEGNGKWLRGDNCLSKRLIHSSIQDLANEDIINIFRVAFSDDQVKKKFTAFFDEANLKNCIEATLLNGFETIIFPMPNPLASRPASISSVRCLDLAREIHQAVFANGPVAQSKKSKEQEKEEAPDFQHRVGFSADLEANRNAGRRLRPSVERPKFFTPTRPDEAVAPCSPISPPRKLSSSCGTLPSSSARRVR